MINGKNYRVGLVGAGYVSEFHIKALKRLPNVRLVGITDIDVARAKATAQSFGIAAFPSLKVMAAEGLDVVHVLTPPSSHVTVALEALSLGCHVLVEKPLATSVEDCDRLIAESQTRGLRVCVNHSLLGDPFVKRALALVKSGAIGDVLTIDYLRSSNYPPYRGGSLPLHYREGGYPFRDLGSHALYLLQEFLGNIEDVHAEFRTSGEKIVTLISTSMNGGRSCGAPKAPATSSFPGTSSRCSTNSSSKVPVARYEPTSLRCTSRVAATRHCRRPLSASSTP